VNHPFDWQPKPTVSPKARVWISSTLTLSAGEQEQPLSPISFPKGEGSQSLAPSNIEAISGQHSLSQIPTVFWHPRVLWVGIGCERGTSQQLLQTAIDQVFEQYQLAVAAIAGVATIALKADEVGLVQLCQAHDWPMQCFEAATLRTVPVPTPSAVVAAEVGTPSVAEAAALQAAQEAGWGADFPTLLVPKQIIRDPAEPGAVTVAVAQAEREWTGRQGQLLLVGMGPGAMAQMTPAAHVAICHADAVIGYQLYLDLLQVPLRPGQIVEPYPITQERQRAQRAIALAQWGLTVAVVSSGDAGIYGMAGLVLEELRAQGWDGHSPAVEVFPGVSALQAAAARVGAPLMHDFCAISLSDRLTPWDVITRRLEAAAQADFVTALYNPRSQGRVEQLCQAQQIFLRYRSAQTPVAIVRAAYRPEEQIELTTLDQLHKLPVDMLTTVLIGNQSTRLYHHWMITPRGYLDGQKEEA
jgi:cobalt-precorrin 5A hydrolase/precorrin-3B C17-methyltransferase